MNATAVRGLVSYASLRLVMGADMSDLNVRISNVTALYVYIEWDPVPGCAGYWLFKDGKRVSWTDNPLQTTTRFLKPLSGSAVYGVAPIFTQPPDSVVYPQQIARKADPLMPLRGV